jgi:hypothetical protein
VTLDDERTFEDEYLVHTPVRLVAIVDDECVDANVDTFQGEVKVRVTTQAFGPVLA